MATTDPVLLQVRDLRQTFWRRGHGESQGDFHALNGLSFELQRGQFVAVVGASGSGKSTLFRCIAGLQQDYVGEILIGAKSDKHNIRSRCAFIFQNPIFFPTQQLVDAVLIGRLGKKSTWQSIVENIFGFYKPEELQMAKEALQRVSLSDWAEQKMGTLSGGQRQRAAIARALLQQPQLLLADEPVSQLDPGISQQILGLLKSLCEREGLSVLCSLHSPELAKHYADRVIGLRAGSIAFDVPVAEFNPNNLGAFYGAGTSS